MPNYHGFRAEDVDVNDGSHLFKLLDDGDGNLTHTEFLGAHKLLVLYTKKNMFFFVKKGLNLKKQHIFFCEREQQQQQQTSVWKEIFFPRKIQHLVSFKISSGLSAV